MNRFASSLLPTALETSVAVASISTAATAPPNTKSEVSSKTFAVVGSLIALGCCCFGAVSVFCCYEGVFLNGNKLQSRESQMSSVHVNMQDDDVLAYNAQGPTMGAGTQWPTMPPPVSAAPFSLPSNEAPPAFEEAIQTTRRGAPRYSLLLFLRILFLLFATKVNLADNARLHMNISTPRSISHRFVCT